MNRIKTLFLLVLMTNMIFLSNAFADAGASATHTVGQENHRFDQGPAKSAEQRAYVIVPNPYADTVPTKPFSSTSLNSKGLWEINDVSPQPIKSTIDAPIRMLETVFIHFDLGSSALSPAETQKLDRLFIIESKGPVQRVTGYTCQIGSFTVNQRLAQDRARTVAAWLSQHGMPVRKIEARPKCCYRATSNLAENRRVEIEFTRGTDQPN